MKILHTADWHLGKRLESISRLEEQKKVLEEICAIANEQNVDAVIIAGDLYDTFNPSTEAIDLFYNSLKRLTNNGTRPVIAVAGNHDSPDKIEVPNPLARTNGIILIGFPKTIYHISQTDLPFSVTNADEGFVEIELANKEKLRIIAAPFANEIRIREYFEDNDKEIPSFLKEFWGNIANKYCDNKGVNIMIGHHLFLPENGEETKEDEDERPIMAISALLPSNCIPPQIQYVALGHLHSLLKVHNKPLMVYSGSPLAYSFAEKNQEKYVLVVDVEPNKNATYKAIPLKSNKKLYSKRCESIAEAEQWLLENQDCIVELTIVSDTFLNSDVVKNLHSLHKNIVRIIPEVTSQQQQNSCEMPSQDKSINELFVDYFKYRNNNQQPTKELIDIFNEILSKES